MWQEEKGYFQDYNTLTHSPHPFEPVTMLWTLWAGIATPSQASLLVSRALPLFELHSGLSVSTPTARGVVSPTNPQKQWEYPYGWAPHQITAWEGLRRYGYEAEAERLAYKWLSMVVRVFSDYNGAVVEKYDVSKTDGERGSHRVDAEYGNQGLGFEGVPSEG